MATNSRDFGECPCGAGAFQSRTVEVSMKLSGQTLLLQEVPQGVCPKCGTRVYPPEHLRRIEELMQGYRLAVNSTQFEA